MQKQIALIPPKYGVWAWKDNENVLTHLYKQNLF